MAQLISDALSFGLHNLSYFTTDYSFTTQVGVSVLSLGVGIAITAWTARRLRLEKENEGLGELITIGYSHYCELGRWALDKPASGVPIAYTESSYPIALHRSPARKHRQHTVPKRKRSETPLFVAPDGSVYPSSAEIVEFAGWQYGDQEFKELLVDSLGRATRRLAYYYALRDVPHIIRDANVDVCQTRFEAALIFVLWYALNLPNGLRRYLGVDASYNPAADVALVDEVFGAVEKRLSESEFLGADGKFGAEDMTFAALAAPALWPDNIPYGGGVFHKYPLSMLPAEFRALAERWRTSAAGQHVRKVYEGHRR